MRVYRNLTVRRHIIEKLGYERFPSKTFSITSLTCCPRKTFYKMTGVKEYVSDETTLIFARGRGHHSVLEVYKLKEIIVTKDDIRGDIDMAEERVTEIFTTMMGLKRMENIEDVEKVFLLKVMQLKAYCYIKDVNEGDLVVFYLMGDWSHPIKPELEVYTLVFDKEELDKNWKLLVDRKEEIECALRDKTPPLLVGEPFECGNCGYAYECLKEVNVGEVKL